MDPSFKIEYVEVSQGQLQHHYVRRLHHVSYKVTITINLKQGRCKKQQSKEWQQHHYSNNIKMMKNHHEHAW